MMSERRSDEGCFVYCCIDLQRLFVTFSFSYMTWTWTTLLNMDMDMDMDRAMDMAGHVMYMAMYPHNNVGLAGMMIELYC